MSVIARLPVAIGLTLALSFPIEAQETGQEDTDAPSSVPVIVFEVSVPRAVADGSLLAVILDMAEAPQLSRVQVSDLFADASGVDATLVFEGLETFSLWRENEMEPFLRPLGGMAGANVTLRIFRSDLLATGHPQQTAAGLGDVSVTYRNSGNDSAGDADIDAVTVICPGDDADCKPSN